MALPADFPQFREGMAQAAHMPSKGRCVTLTPSTTNTKPQHFSPTLTSSPCLITLPNMAPSGLKLLGCTSRIPLEHGFSPVPLASMTARTSTFQATASLLFRPSLFFLSDGCMAQRSRCPGGRPSVSANKRIHDAYYSVVKWQLSKPSINTEYDQQSPRVPLSVLASPIASSLPSILKRYFCGELTIHQFESLLNARQAEDDKELDAAATECRRMKRAKQTLARLPHPAASSTTTSAPLVPAPLGHTPPPSPRIPPRPIGMHPGPPLTEPSSSTAAPSFPAPPPHSICRL